MTLTERDIQVLSFFAKYRFCTRGQLVEAGFFPNDRVCQRRLSTLLNAKYIRAGVLGRSRYYYLAPAGGLQAGLSDLDTSRRYRDAPRETVVLHLIWADFALARGVSYLGRQEALEELRGRGANLTAIRVLTARGVRLYRWQRELHALLVDTGQGNFPGRVRDLARLPPGLFFLDVLVFSQTRQAQVERVLAIRARRAQIITAAWKYY